MKFQVEYSNTPFEDTSESGWPNRQNWRCEILLTRNLHAVEGKRILDIASHDGRLSYGLKKLGATHVVGVEGRDWMVENSKRNFSKLGLEADFIHGDIFDYLPTVESGAFDTICCFGFFYHTMKQYELVSQIKRIKPKYLILDSNVVLYDDPVFKIRWESYTSMGKTIDPLGLVLEPSRAAIEFMFTKFGFKVQYLDWHTAGVDNWKHLENYKAMTRISYLCELS